jgi:hypothetical protein
MKLIFGRMQRLHHPHKFLFPYGGTRSFAVQHLIKPRNGSSVASPAFGAIHFNSDVCVKWPARTAAAVAEARVLSKNVEAHV